MLVYVCARFFEQWLAKAVSRKAKYFLVSLAACISTALLVTRASILRVSRKAVLTWPVMLYNAVFIGYQLDKSDSGSFNGQVGGP